MLAIAAQKSSEWNHEGVFHAEAMDEELLEYYCSEFHAWKMPLHGHPFHFIIEETASQKLKEVYTYEWTDDEL